MYALLCVFVVTSGVVHSTSANTRDASGTNNCPTFQYWSNNRHLRFKIESLDEYAAEDFYTFILGGAPSCRINISAVYSEMVTLFAKDERSTFRVRLTVGCYNKMSVGFEMPHLKKSTDSFSIIIDLIVSNLCSISVKELSSLSQIGTMDTVLFADDLVVGNVANCSFARDLRVLHMVNVAQTISSENMNTVMDSCPETFPNLLDLILNYTSSASCLYPMLLEIKFPNIQELKIINAHINSTLRFPWFMESTTGTNATHVQPTPCCMICFTYINEKQRSITPDPAFVFRDDVQQITVNGIYADSLTADMFRTVAKLVDLNLSNNSLDTVLKPWFENKTHMFRLILSHNNLGTIAHDTFEDLLGLEYLDLSYNKLTTLEVGVFEKLSKLKQIHLEFNSLHKLQANVFAFNIFSLEAMYAYSNPLEDIPVYPVYAPLLIMLDLHNTSVNSDSIIRLLADFDSLDIEFVSLIQNYQEGYQSKATETGLRVKTIDLSHCNITKFPLFDDAGVALNSRADSFQSFIFDNVKLDGNPLHCGCQTYVIQHMISFALSLVQVPHGRFDGWKCGSPPELLNRKLMSIERREMLCEKNVTHCPDSCSCRERQDESSMVINCKNTSMRVMPTQIPCVNKLELWFQFSHIGRLEKRNYYSNVSMLDLSHSKIKFIDPEIFNQFNFLEVLNLDSSFLSTLPRSIMSVNLTQLFLKNNPFICDCRLLWLKSWMVTEESPIMDWESVKCTFGSQKATLVVEVPDTKFVCQDELFNQVKHVLLPSIIIGSSLFVLVVVSLLVFYQRLLIKVLLFVYCGIRPFDKDDTTANACIYDACAIYGYEGRSFMQTQVVDYLTKKGHRIADMYNDFIIGESFTWNVKMFIEKSRRVIMFVDSDLFNDELIRYAWNLSYEVTVKQQTNFIILILDINMPNQRDGQNKEFNRFIKHKRFIRNDSVLLRKSLDYFLPRSKISDYATNNVNGSLETVFEMEMEMRNARLNDDIYITYQEDIDQDIRHKLIPTLKQKGELVKVFEFEYMPGASIDEEMIDLIERSGRLIYILSETTLRDEHKCLILKHAIAKTMACGYNYLLLFTYGKVHENLLTRDLRSYLDTHVTIRMEDKHFLKRLMQALSADRSHLAPEVGLIDEEILDDMNLPLV